MHQDQDPKQSDVEVKDICVCCCCVALFVCFVVSLHGDQGEDDKQRLHLLHLLRQPHPPHLPPPCSPLIFCSVFMTLCPPRCDAQRSGNAHPRPRLLRRLWLHRLHQVQLHLLQCRCRDGRQPSPLVPRQLCKHGVRKGNPARFPLTHTVRLLLPQLHNKT